MPQMNLTRLSHWKMVKAKVDPIWKLVGIYIAILIIIVLIAKCGIFG